MYNVFVIVKKAVAKTVKIYLVRHCEATGNADKLFQGHTDCDITPRGKNQLEYLQRRFKNVHIDRAYSSPLRRALKTTRAAVWGKDVELIPDERFIEVNCGVADGVPFSIIETKYENFWEIWNNRPEDFAPKNGETMRAAAERFWQGVTAVASAPENEGKTLLIGTHGGVLRTLFCRLIHGNLEMLSKTDGSGNTAVSLLTYESGELRVEYLNDTSHLPDTLVTKSPLITIEERKK